VNIPVKKEETMKRQILLFMITCFSISSISSIDVLAAEGDIYKVGINDVLEIRVLEHDELGTIATVTADGSITFPYLGSVYVKDKGLSEIEKEITKRLGEEYVKYPVVSVSLRTSISEKIYVYGEASRIGEVIFGEGMTVLNALSMAGGIPENGLYGGKVKVRRRQDGELGFKDIEIDLKGIVDGSATADILLQPDDILIVERDKFFIYGEVGRPGEYGLEDDMTVARALSVSGGIREDGLYGKVKVRRRQDGESGYKDIEIDFKGIIEGSATADMLLEPDDILIVERNKTFFIHGELGKPGQYALEDGMTVVRALSVAGGIREDGLYGKVKVRRKQEGEPGYKDIEIDLKGNVEGSATADMFLQSDDILIVERNKTFFIYGEVNKPGQYVLEKDMTVFKALSLTGGFTKWGSSSRVKVLRQKKNNTGFATIKIKINDIIDGDAGADIDLQPGDIVVVSTGMF